jgi:hypothetical protein
MSLNCAGAKQLSTYPVSIPYHGMGLNITLQSYNGGLDFGIILLKIDALHTRTCAAYERCTQGIATAQSACSYWSH